MDSDFRLLAEGPRKNCNFSCLVRRRYGLPEMHRPLGRVAFSGGVEIFGGAPPGRSGCRVLTLLGHTPQTKGVVKRQRERSEREVTDCRLETT